MPVCPGTNGKAESGGWADLASFDDSTHALHEAPRKIVLMARRTEPPQPAGGHSGIVAVLEDPVELDDPADEE